VNGRTGDVIPLDVGILEQVEELGTTALNIPAAAERIRAPWLIVHGSDDETVPLHEAENLKSVAHTNATLRILEKVNHSFGGKHPLAEVTPALESVTRETVEFFRQNLAPSQR
jgi:pimeloyl-ACP methyl ester carboxylesterase